MDTGGILTGRPLLSSGRLLAAAAVDDNDDTEFRSRDNIDNRYQ